jgi:NAD(P)-dependent dehydrogenase (short-subunit alcohol dehydrogenase family)
MVDRKSGRIISVASIQGFASSGAVGSYNAAERAITAYSQSMAVELGPHNILVYAVTPGFMRTPTSMVTGVDKTETPDFIQGYVKRGSARAFLRHQRDRASQTLARAGHDADLIAQQAHSASHGARSRCVRLSRSTPFSGILDLVL